MMGVPELSLKVQPELLPAFFSLLGHGFSVQAPIGCNIKEYLCSHLDIDADYFDERIQTLFLNGSAVDDPVTAVITADSVLALSGAMPGLAGATLRRGGFYGRLRGEISYDSDSACDASGECRIRMKLFNLVVRDLGPRFLEKGIQVQAEALADLLDRNGDRIKSGCVSAQLDGKSIALETLDGSVLPKGDIRLTVRT